VELAIVAPEDEDKYPFVRPSSAPADVMDRPGRIITEWENMDFDEQIQADPKYIDRIIQVVVILYLMICVDPEAH
jgi:hypothetical protein